MLYKLLYPFSAFSFSPLYPYCARDPLLTPQSVAHGVRAPVSFHFNVPLLCISCFEFLFGYRVRGMEGPALDQINGDYGPGV